MDRRDFLRASAAVSAALPSYLAAEPAGRRLESSGILGKLKSEPGGWYTAEAEGDGLSFQFPAGTLASARYVAADMLLDTDAIVCFVLMLREGENGRAFRFSWGGLPQASFRVRMPLDLVDQNRWMIEREGAFLKPIAGGDRVDLEKVDRMTFAVRRKAPGTVRWRLSPVIAAPGEVERLAAPELPKGKLLDRFGQSTIRNWPGKTRGEAELRSRIQEQYAAASTRKWPEGFSAWGGHKAKKLGEGTGYFRTQRDDRRWWLVDPDGYAFWSAGADCVRVDTDARYDGLETALEWIPPQSDARMERGRGKGANFLAANMIRVFGADGWREKWARIALSEMKAIGFNTVGNWSEWEFAAKARFPYVRPLSFRGMRSGMIYRDFPDVFHPGFAEDAADYASQLTVSAKDPALIGYFLMNEPTWGFSSEVPAAGMLFTSETCHSRNELARFLRKKYADDAALASAWKMPATYEKIARGKWISALSKEAIDDLRDFSVIMVEHYFRTLSTDCRKADPNHLNLGMRWAGVPPSWAVQGMKFFDVFSLNCYRQKLPVGEAEKIHAMLGKPVMVGEWHFGALDVGLPANGIGSVKNQADRGRAYRVYLEDAAADPYCVGVHWFTLYDQSALGRFDGENYNIGFLDVCNRSYAEISAAALESHRRMYAIAEGKAAPYADAPEYLPMLFL